MAAQYHFQDCWQIRTRDLTVQSYQLSHPGRELIILTKIIFDLTLEMIPTKVGDNIRFREKQWNCISLIIYAILSYAKHGTHLVQHNLEGKTEMHTASYARSVKYKMKQP